jgi:hypothetical protein
MFTGRPKQVTPEMAPILDCHPAQVQRSAYNGGRPVSRDPAAPSNGQRSKDSYTAMLAMTNRLYDAGIPILAGTDDTASLYLHRELELEVLAGIPAPKALQIPHTTPPSSSRNKISESSHPANSPIWSSSKATPPSTSATSAAAA